MGDTAIPTEASELIIAMALLIDPIPFLAYLPAVAHNVLDCYPRHANKGVF